MKIWLAIVFMFATISFVVITVVILLLGFLIVEPIIRLSPISVAQ
jgi:hypothetical protein